jgi:hypothetical protein
VSYGQNNCDAGATCNLQLDNTVQFTAEGASKVNADIDVKLNGENNCDAGETCDLKLSRTIIIEAEDGQEVNAVWHEEVNLECDGGDSPCVDEKTIKCTINGCEEVVPVVLESRDAIAADQGLIVTPDALQTECSSGGTECSGPPMITVPTDELAEKTEVGAAAPAEVIPIDSTTPRGTVTSPSLMRTTSSTPTAITDPSQITAEPPLETASIVAQEEEQKPLEALKESSSQPADAVIAEATENNADVDSDDKISATAEESPEEDTVSDSNKIENVGEDTKEEVDDDAESAETSDTNTDDSETSGTSNDSDDQDSGDNGGEENDTTDNSDGDEPTETDDSGSEEDDNNSESEDDGSGESGGSGSKDDSA